MLHGSNSRYLTLRSGRMAEQLDQLHAIQRERDEALRRYEAQINERYQQLREIVVLKVRVWATADPTRSSSPRDG